MPNDDILDMPPYGLIEHFLSLELGQRHVMATDYRAAALNRMEDDDFRAAQVYALFAISQAIKEK